MVHGAAWIKNLQKMKLSLSIDYGIKNFAKIIGNYFLSISSFLDPYDIYLWLFGHGEKSLFNAASSGNGSFI